MEVREPDPDWPGNLDTAFVVRWTDAGWLELERRGLRPDMRRRMDIDASRFLLDLEYRERQMETGELRETWLASERLVQQALAKIAVIVEAHAVVGADQDEAYAVLTALRSAERIFEAGYKPPKENRRTRDVFLGFVLRIDVITRQCRMPLVRSNPSIELVEFILKAIAPFAETYFATLTELGEKRAKELASEIRQVSAAQLVRRVSELSRPG